MTEETAQPSWNEGFRPKPCAADKLGKDGYDLQGCVSTARPVVPHRRLPRSETQNTETRTNWVFRRIPAQSRKSIDVYDKGHDRFVRSLDEESLGGA